MLSPFVARLGIGCALLTTACQSELDHGDGERDEENDAGDGRSIAHLVVHEGRLIHPRAHHLRGVEDRKSTRLNSSHSQISYAVFCLKKKKKKKQNKTKQ